MYLVLYSHENDPVLRAFENYQAQEGKEEVLLLNIKDLLREVIIYDEIENGNVSLNWKLKDGRTIRNDDDVKLVSRVLSVPEELFDDYHPEDMEYARSEFYAYLAFAINSFEQKINNVTSYGLCGPNYPIIYQWENNKRMLSRCGVKTPNYYLGEVEKSNEFLDNEKIIASDMYDYYNWKALNIDEIEKLQGHHFLIERPEGEPVCVLYSSDVITFQPNVKINVSDVDKIKKSVEIICKNLELNIAELLFFVSEKCVTFCMSSSFLRSLNLYYEYWEEDVVKGISSYFR